MEDKKGQEGMLSPYRVLDLTDEKGLLCGKLLGDLGADVIKIERPGGDPARSLGPFYHDEVDPEKSLFWFAFNTSKRGITLDIETADGQETFKRLVKGADFVIESFPPGYMDKLGLGYSALEELNPRVIMVSITPFGQTGPYKDYKAPDIVAWAMGGQMYPTGDPDRRPIRISHHSQSYLHGGAEAAVGAMMALYHREITGEGQHIDVSIQESVARCTERHTASWDVAKEIPERGGLRPVSGVHFTMIWPCKDGHVVWFYFGLWGRGKDLPLVEWMMSEGIGKDMLEGFSWEAFNPASANKEETDRVEEPTLEFFMNHTKAELLEGALKRRLILYPVSNAKDMLESVQLADRGFWVELEHPELGTSITYPGAFTGASEKPPRVSRRAPLIGEHNQEILQKELSLSSGYPRKLSKKGVGKNQDKKLLDGIKIVDFSWALTGPITTKYFSDAGAEVIKIESRSRTDSLRISPPFKDSVPGPDRGGQFNQHNTGKLSVALNLSHPKGVEVAKRFVSRADIVIENFAGGVIDRMGLGYGELKRVKPDIIMLSTGIQGRTGPYATQPGYGYHLAALSGFYEITGWPDLMPVGPHGPYTDFVAPRFCALAIIAALDYRRRTGKGQYLDLSQYETGVHFLAPLILDYAVNQRVGSRMGNRYPYAAPHNAYRCLGNDRWCAIAVFTDEEWQSFCKVIGNPAWTNDPKFSTLAARKENEEDLDRLVDEWTMNHSAEEVMTMMQSAGVAAGIAETGEDMLEHDPQLKHRGYFRELDHPEIGKYHSPGFPFVLSKSRYEVRRAPLLGEHNEYALKKILGMSDEEIAKLVIEEVLE